MDKILPDMRSGHIKLLNLGHLRNLTLTEENLVLSMATTCKIDKLIVMNENRPYIQEILSKKFPYMDKIINIFTFWDT